MRKEGVLAIILGSALGLVIAFGIWRTNQVYVSKQNQEAAQSPSPTGTEAPNTNQQEAQYGLTIAKPEDEDVLTDTSFELTGLAKPNNILILTTPDEDFMKKADAKGEFSVNLEANGGTNNLAVRSISLDNSLLSKSLVIVYTSKLVIPTEQTETSTDSGSIEQKVRDKVNQALNRPKAYIGSITDITENAIQIKNLRSEVKQISISKTTTYAKVGKVTKDIEFADLAIGDSIIAMGFKNGNNILAAGRILVDTSAQTIPPSFILGKISAVTKKQLTVAEVGKEITWAVTYTSDVKIQNLEKDVVTDIAFADLETNNVIAIVGDAKDNAFTARSIFVINSGK